MSKSPRGLKIKSSFGELDVDPLDKVHWKLFTAQISDETGKIYFEQKDVEAPADWSQTAVNVVVSKYFRGHVGTPSRETSVRQLISRVADTITKWGLAQHYFVCPADSLRFNSDLKYLLVHQMLAFNSPVWFNVGVEAKPQCSACFINSVDDTMESILTLAKTEGMLFKWGSGTGTNFSALRSSKEKLRGGGTASGPVSFMRGFDAFAGVIKSGGKTRRAAKMVILNADHPDIIEFIECKANEEKKAHALIDAGYDGSFTGEAYATISFQNANNSVRVTDAFMEAVIQDETWSLVSRTTGNIVATMQASEVWNAIAHAAHACGDPGLQFHTTINDWHTSANTAPINASNPCSEYMFLDDSACNLASLNLRKFVVGGKFSPEMFEKAVHVSILAQEILVDNASYPTEKIAKNSHAFRPLGLGYANLGALLMAFGLPYDSEEARAVAGAITSLMTGAAYAYSSLIAQRMGACSGFKANKEPFLKVIAKHKNANEQVAENKLNVQILARAKRAWTFALDMGEEYGYRNAQVTVLAPTGTIGFMMDCDTTGIEPDIALVKYKRLVGGGTMTIINRSIDEALINLGYGEEVRQRIVKFVRDHGTIEGSPDLSASHLPVFDCAFRPANGTRTIHYMGHVKMMAAAQPFLSGAISKTVNLPSDCTVDDIKSAYLEAWRLGLKAIAVYRDGCKRSQPLSTAAKENTKGLVAPVLPTAVQRVLQFVELQTAAPDHLKRGEKRQMPDTRLSLTHRFVIGGQKGYLTVGLYPDGSPGELFIEMSKQGSFSNGIVDALSKAVTKGLKYGVPLEELAQSYINTRFDPAGMTHDPGIRITTSIVDYIFRWLMMVFSGPVNAQLEEAVSKSPVRPQIAEGADGTVCHECGSMMIRSGACHKCINCGSTSGCS